MTASLEASCVLMDCEGWRREPGRPPSDFGLTFYPPARGATGYRSELESLRNQAPPVFVRNRSLTPDRLQKRLVTATSRGETGPRPVEAR